MALVEDPRKIYVSQLPFGCTYMTLEDYFGQYGPCRARVQLSNRGIRIGFVCFMGANAETAARQVLMQSETKPHVVMGLQLHVEVYAQKEQSSSQRKRETSNFKGPPSGQVKRASDTQPRPNQVIDSSALSNAPEDVRKSIFSELSAKTVVFADVDETVCMRQTQIQKLFQAKYPNGVTVRRSVDGREDNMLVMELSEAETQQSILSQPLILLKFEDGAVCELLAEDLASYKKKRSLLHQDGTSVKDLEIFFTSVPLCLPEEAIRGHFASFGDLGNFECSVGSWQDGRLVGPHRWGRVTILGVTDEGEAVILSTDHVVDSIRISVKRHRGAKATPRQPTQKRPGTTQKLLSVTYMGEFSTEDKRQLLLRHYSEYGTILFSEFDDSIADASAPDFAQATIIYDNSTVKVSDTCLQRNVTIEGIGEVDCDCFERRGLKTIDCRSSPALDASAVRDAENVTSVLQYSVKDAHRTPLSVWVTDRPGFLVEQFRMKGLNGVQLALKPSQLNPQYVEVSNIPLRSHETATAVLNDFSKNFVYKSEELSRVGLLDALIDPLLPSRISGALGQFGDAQDSNFIFAIEKISMEVPLGQGMPFRLTYPVDSALHLGLETRDALWLLPCREEGKGICALSGLPLGMAKEVSTTITHLLQQQRECYRENGFCLSEVWLQSVPCTLVFFSWDRMVGPERGSVNGQFYLDMIKSTLPFGILGRDCSLALPIGGCLCEENGSNLYPLLSGLAAANAVISSDYPGLTLELAFSDADNMKLVRDILCEKVHDNIIETYANGLDPDFLASCVSSPADSDTTHEDTLDPISIPLPSVGIRLSLDVSKSAFNLATQQSDVDLLVFFESARPALAEAMGERLVNKLLTNRFSSKMSVANVGGIAMKASVVVLVHASQDQANLTPDDYFDLFNLACDKNCGSVGIFLDGPSVSTAVLELQEMLTASSDLSGLVDAIKLYCPPSELTGLKSIFSTGDDPEKLEDVLRVYADLASREIVTSGIEERATLKMSASTNETYKRLSACVSRLIEEKFVTVSVPSEFYQPLLYDMPRLKALAVRNCMELKYTNQCTEAAMLEARCPQSFSRQTCMQLKALVREFHAPTQFENQLYFCGKDHTWRLLPLPLCQFVEALKHRCRFRISSISVAKTTRGVCCLYLCAKSDAREYRLCGYQSVLQVSCSAIGDVSFMFFPADGPPVEWTVVRCDTDNISLPLTWDCMEEMDLVGPGRMKVLTESDAEFVNLIKKLPVASFKISRVESPKNHVVYTFHLRKMAEAFGVLSPDDKICYLPMHNTQRASKFLEVSDYKQYNLNASYEGAASQSSVVFRCRVCWAQGSPEVQHVSSDEILAYRGLIYPEYLIEQQ